MDYESVLSRLCRVPAPSGFEGEMALTAAELLRPLVDEVSVDRMGSVLGVRRCGKAGAPSVLLDAHLDGIGFMVTGHEDGFLRFCTLGGADPRILPDQEVTLLTDPPLSALVTVIPPHIQTSEERDKTMPEEELFLDPGLSPEEAEKRIPIGTPGVCRGTLFPLGEDCLCGTALDDRACFAVLLDTLEQLRGETLNVDLLVLGSVQEETNGTGAITAAFRACPQMCVAVDVTHGDSPDARGEQTFPLGGGPVVGLGPNCARWMSRRLRDKAEELEMEVGLEVMTGSSGTNGWEFQIAREGVATAVLSVPLRYMHSPTEVVHRRNLAQTACLLAAFLRDLGRDLEKEAPPCD